MTTLADLVRATLSSAEASMKVASARDSAPTAGADLDFLADLDPPKLAEEHCDEDDSKESPKKQKEKSASLSTVVSDADYAQKLAEALTIGSNIVSQKLASKMPTMESGHMERATFPKAHSKVTGKITGPSTQGPNGLPTNKADFTSPGDQSGRAKNSPSKTAGWTKDRAAATSMLRAKMAQAEELKNAGQLEAAQSIFDEIEKAAMKMQTEPPVSTHVPDNAGIVALTRAAARDKTTQEARKYFSEPPKKDPMIAATQLKSEGAKISSVALPSKTASMSPEVGRAYLQKLTKTASDPHATSAEREKAAGVLKAIKARTSNLS